MSDKPFCYFDRSISMWVLFKHRRGQFLAYCFDLADVISTLEDWKRNGTVAHMWQPLIG